MKSPTPLLDAIKGEKAREVCKRGHVGRFLLRPNKKKTKMLTYCGACAVLSKRRNYLKNKEKVRKYQREYAKLNAEKAKEKARRWYKKNTESALESAKKWRKANPEKVKLQRKLWYGVPENRIKNTLTQAKKRATAKGLDFSITLDDLLPLPEVCPVFGIKLNYKGAQGFMNDSPSIDRIDSSKGYVKGNIQIISWHISKHIRCCQRS